VDRRQVEHVHTEILEIVKALLDVAERP